MGKIPSNLGIVIPGFSGVYDSNRQYEFYEFVRDNGDTYVSKKPSKGISTSNEEYWFRITDMYGFAQGTITGSTGAISQINIPDFYAGVPLDVTAKFVATQEGSGETSPENVRPITGRNVLNVVRTGKNFRSQGISRGNPLVGGGSGAQTNRLCDTYHVYIFPGTYIVSCNPSMQVQVYIYSDTTKNAQITNPFSGWQNSPKSFTVIAAGYYRCAYRYADDRSIVPSDITSVQLELGSAATPYEPYNGQAYSVTLPEAVYGLPGMKDEVDLERGIITRRTKQLTFLNSNGWSVGAVSTNTVTYTYNTLSGGNYGPRIYAIMSHLPPGTSTGDAADSVHFRTSSANTNLLAYWPKSVVPNGTLADLSNFFAAEAAAGRPVQVLYELAAPQTLSINPVTISSLPGLNNVYTDGVDEVSTSLSYFIHQTNTMQAMWNEIQLLKNAIAGI